MSTENIPIFDSFFSARPAASEYFRNKYGHILGAAIDTKQETPGGIIITFKSKEDFNCKGRYKCFIREENKLT